jgi:anaerobic magnesium-protoporphyrin IX monomethyl ester cyclase
MKVVLISPPHYESSDDRLDPPLGLLYIAAHLEKNNINVKVTDLSGTPEEDWHIPYADIYGITVYITSLSVTHDIVKKCREVNPSCKIVVGGAHPSARPNDFDFADQVVVGNGEVAMVEIAQGKETKHIVIGKQPEDLFIFPAYHLIKPETYHRKIDGKTSLPYLTSRGCPYNCAFCGLNTMHKLGSSSVKLADPGIVFSHIQRIKEEFGVDRIAVQDDIFTLSIPRLKKILGLIKPLNIRFRCMGRAGYDTEETYKILADAGCEQVSWGVESGSQYILDRMNKRVTVQDNYNVIQWAKKYGITSRAFFVIFFPGETRETLEETKRFIMDSGVSQYFISSFVPYPGTQCGDFPEKFGITNIDKDYSKFYQVSKNGTGGMPFDTQWLSQGEAKELEVEFREWLKENKPFVGAKQDYEKVLYENKTLVAK